MRLAALLALVPAVALAQPNFEPAKAAAVDPATLKQIEARRAELARAVAALPAALDPTIRTDVEVYAKAAEWVVRHGEFFAKDSPKQTLAVIDAGLARAKAAADGKAPWRDVRGKPVVRGYRSRIDDSVQPYSVTLPPGYGTDGKKWRLDVVLHGRDQTLTEVKFIAAREASKGGSKADYVVLEPYGRGNNAYRWAGETDVIEAAGSFLDHDRQPIDRRRVVLRGFSMGGAGTWHLGLHRPFAFAVIGPGAGFTTTHGYVKTLPAKLPAYQEACLHIYDAVDYAENAFDVPVVAYSGEKDVQKAAADNIEVIVKLMPEPVRFTHVVAPGLEHKQPPEWQAKLDAEYRKHLAADRPRPERVRFVTYTTAYGDAQWAAIEALDRHYARAVVDATWTTDRLEVSTSNVRGLRLTEDGVPFPAKLRIDGQQLAVGESRDSHRRLLKRDGRWAVADDRERTAALMSKPEKTPGLQGPIDDAFRERVTVVPPTGPSWFPGVTAHATAAMDRFGREWDKFFRGTLPTADPTAGRKIGGSLVLFGDPGSNPYLARIADRLPITWTKDRLVVNGKEYDPKTHVPVMIYPDPLDPTRYVVLNSGHTFRAADLKGTNALLYPRLGDWAVLRPTPTEKDPSAAEVVDAGLFDEFWRFPAR
jgi:dienelactone hydrolase